MAKSGGSDIITKLLKRADDALEKKNYGLAVMNYTEALNFRPADLETRAKLRNVQLLACSKQGKGSMLTYVINIIKANIFKTIGKPEKALYSCELALGCNPQSVPAMKLLASAAKKAGLLDVAIWQHKDIAERYAPQDVNNLTSLGFLCMDEGKGTEAVEAFQKAQSIDPGLNLDRYIRDASAIASTNVFEQGVEKGATSIVANDEERQNLENLASNMRTDEQRIKAIEYIVANDIPKRPEDHKLYQRVGELYADFEDLAVGYKKAKEYYDKAYEINNTDSSTLDRIGDLEMKNNRYNIDLLKEKVKQSGSEEDKQTLADYEKKSREYELVEYERRVKAQPLKMEFHYRLGELYMLNNRLDEAVSEFQKAAKDHKWRVAALVNLGRTFHKLNQFDLAIGQFEAAREGQEVFAKLRDPLYFEAKVRLALNTPEERVKALKLLQDIYQTDISYRDVKDLFPKVQEMINQDRAAVAGK